MTRSKLFVRILFSLGCIIGGKLPAQEFLNGDLWGPMQPFNALPLNWQSVPYSDPCCQATAAWCATPNITSYTGPDSVSGIIGNPYSGTTFISGLHCQWGSSTFHEGIQQTLSGLVPFTTYTVHFHQTVVQQNSLDSSGSWALYVDNTLFGVSAPTLSSALFNSTSLVWESRTLSFNPWTTSHTIALLPMDDDAMLKIPHGIRMGIDCIYINNPCDSIPKTGAGDNVPEAAISLYPNPAADAVTVRYGGHQRLQVTLYDPAAKMVRQEEASDGTIISVSDLAPGMYFYEIRAKSGIIRKGKLIRL